MTRKMRKLLALVLTAMLALGMCAVGADYGYSEPGELAGAGAIVVFDTVEAMGEWMLGAPFHG